MRKKIHGVFKRDSMSQASADEKVEMASYFIKLGELERLRDVYPLEAIQDAKERNCMILTFARYGKLDEIYRVYSPEQVKVFLMGSEAQKIETFSYLRGCILEDNLEGLKCIILISGTDISGCPGLLSLACISSTVTMIRFLLDQGIDPNAIDDFNNSPLFVATLFNKFTTICLLDRSRSKDSDQLIASSRNKAIRLAAMLELIDESMAKSVISPLKYYSKQYKQITEKDEAVLYMKRLPERLRGRKLRDEKTSISTEITTLKERYLNKFPILKDSGQKDTQAEIAVAKYMVALSVKELSGDDMIALRERKAFLDVHGAHPFMLLSLELLIECDDVDQLIKRAAEFYSKSGNNPEVLDQIIGLYVGLNKEAEEHDDDKEETAKLFFAAYDLLKISKLNNSMLKYYRDIYNRSVQCLSSEACLEYLLHLHSFVKKHKDSSEVKEFLKKDKEFKGHIKTSIVKFCADLALEAYNSNPEKALEYCDIAFKFDKEHDGVFAIYTDILINSGRYVEAEAVCKQAQCTDSLKQLTLLNLRVSTQQLSLEEGFQQYQAMKINDAQKVACLRFFCMSLMERYRHREAMGLITEIIAAYDGAVNDGYKGELDEHLIRLMLCYTHLGQPEKVLNFEFKNRFSSKKVWEEDPFVVFLKIYACLKSNKAEEAIKLRMSARAADVARIAENIHIFSTVFDGNVDVLLSSINLLSEAQELTEDPILKRVVGGRKESIILLLPERHRAQFSKPIYLPNSLLKEEVVQAEQEEQQQEEQQQEERSAEEKEYDWADYDPKKDHEACQLNKSPCLSYKPTCVNKQMSWTVKGVRFSEKGGNVCEIDSVFFSKHRSAVSPDIDVDPRLIKAVNRGLCPRAFGSNGVKTLPNGMFEAKHKKCSNRLLASAVYLSETDEPLVLFDDVCTHAQIKNICRTQKLDTRAFGDYL